MANVVVGLRKALDAQLDHAIAEVRSENLSSENALRGHLQYVLAGSIRKRVIGADLLGAGVLLEIDGAIVGALVA